MGKRSSIFYRILIASLAILLLETGIFMLVFQAAGIIRRSEEITANDLVGRVKNRQLYLQNDMTQKWTYFTATESIINTKFQAYLEEKGMTMNQALASGTASQDMVQLVSGDVVDMLRRNGTTGAFLVLDGHGRSNQAGSHPGFHIRDYSPDSYSANNSDLLLERGLVQGSARNSYAMDSYWQAYFVFDLGGQAPEGQFFFQPIRAARQSGETRSQSSYFRYWSEPFSMTPNDRPVITCTVPIIWNDGTVLGVLGIEVTMDYFGANLMHEGLDSDGTGVFLLGRSTDGGKTYTIMAQDGPNFNTYFGSGTTVVTATPTPYEGVVTLTSKEKKNGRTLYGGVEPLRLYENNTPFLNEEWALIGVMDGQRLMAYPAQMQSVILLAAGISMVLGLCIVVLLSRSVSRPITLVAAQLRQSNPAKPILLDRLGLLEIDELTASIENLSNAALTSARRTSDIIEMTGLPVGVFERLGGDKGVFCSRSLFRLLGWENHLEDDYLSQEAFGQRIATITAHPDPADTNRFCIEVEGKERWVQFFYRETSDGGLGAFQDVTREVEEKRRLAYERDYDVLTGLYNRRAFDTEVDSLLAGRAGAVGMGVLLMIDLDNLKFVNDSYGHDYGDRYIQAFATFLERFYPNNVVISRRSGDEFNVFLYGQKTKDELRALVDEVWDQMSDIFITLPGGGKQRVRASGGMAWYPQDGQLLSELLRRADFAMYTGKHTTKGSLIESSREEYEAKAILISGQDSLNRTIEERLVDYALQPIVRVSDGSVYGYEMLMRPQLSQFRDPGEMFRLARAQSKLHHIETLTWIEAMNTFARHRKAGRVEPEVRVFINSLGNQCLSEANTRVLEERFPELLPLVTLEITEDEVIDPVYVKYKRDVLDRWGAQMALDDYGAGFNSNTALVSYHPNLVKVDISLVHGVDKDQNRLDLLCGLMHYAKERNIAVLAEGVETKEELDTVIAVGVDYIQGYYVGYPTLIPQGPPSEIVTQIQQAYKKHTQG